MVIKGTVQRGMDLIDSGISQWVSRLSLREMCQDFQLILPTLSRARGTLNFCAHLVQALGIKKILGISNNNVHTNIEKLTRTWIRNRHGY